MLISVVKMIFFAGICSPILLTFIVQDTSC